MQYRLRLNSDIPNCVFFAVFSAENDKAAEERAKDIVWRLSTEQIKLEPSASRNRLLRKIVESVETATLSS